MMFFKILPNGTKVWIETLGVLECYHADSPRTGLLSQVSTIQHNCSPGEYARALELAAKWFREIENTKRQTGVA